MVLSSRLQNAKNSFSFEKYYFLKYRISYSYKKFRNQLSSKLSVSNVTPIKRIFDDIKKVRKINEIPNFWKTLANDPETLERTWNSLKQVMKEGSLDTLTKELIYVSVSMTNSCEYCIRSHTKSAKKKGMTDNMLKELIAVVAMANETNRLVESYQVEVDSFLK